MVVTREGTMIFLGSLPGLKPTEQDGAGWPREPGWHVESPAGTAILFLVP